MYDNLNDLAKVQSYEGKAMVWIENELKEIPNGINPKILMKGGIREFNRRTGNKECNRKSAKEGNNGRFIGG